MANSELRNATRSGRIPNIKEAAIKALKAMKKGKRSKESSDGESSIEEVCLCKINSQISCLGRNREL